MHLRIPNTPITIIGDPCQASSVPLSGHVELACKPSQAATITSIQLALVRTTKIKKQESSSLLPGRRLSFGNSRSPTRDKRTYVEELMQWTIAYSPSHTANTSGSAATPRRGSNDTTTTTTTTTTTALIPFNIRIPGHLSATTTTPLGSTTYTLTATALTTTPTTPTKNLKTDSPLHLTRALHLPHGPASVLLRRRFPQSALSTRLTLPGVLRPAAADFTAHLTLHGTVTRHGRTTTHLCVRRLDWRIEEHTLAFPSSPKPHQKHVRKLAAGKWEGGRSANKWTGNLEELALPPSRPGAFEGDDDDDMAVAFPVSIPASARALCGNGLQQQQQQQQQHEESGGPRLGVSHVLVLELHTVELKYGAETGELVNMYPFPQRKFGAVYDVEVQNWDYDGAAGMGGGEVVPPAARTTNAAALALAMPCGEVLGEWPPSYDSVAVM